MSNNNSLNQPNISSNSLLAKLLIRGDSISITNGILIIESQSGLEVPSAWLKANTSLLTKEICQFININAFQYLSYTTGRYGSKKTEGLSLQFINVLTHDDAYTIFNANLKRTRTSKHGIKGAPLPNKQFTVSAKHNFYKFWSDTNLKFPTRLSSFHDYMGKLKSLIFIGEMEKQKRIIKTSLKPLNISFNQIKSAVFTAISEDKRTAIPNNFQTDYKQRTINSQTRIPDKNFSPAHTSNTLERNTSTCNSKYGNTFIREKEIRNQLTTSKTQNIASGDESCIKSSYEHRVEKKRPEDQTVDEWLADWETAFTPEEFQK